MNTGNGNSFGNTEQAAACPKRVPSLTALTVCSVAGAAAAILIPELGLAAVTLMIAFITYTVSARAPLPILLIPAAGVALCFVRGGAWFFAVAAAIAVGAVIAGATIGRGGDFMTALMSFTLVELALAAVLAASYMRLRGLTLQGIYNSLTVYVHDAVAGAISTLGDRLTLEEAELMTEQYEAVISSTLVYVPAVISWGIELCAIIALRLTGALHTVTGSVLYPKYRRSAAVSRVFAVIYLVSMLAGAVSSGIVGCSAGNIMLVLMLPAAAAGVSVYHEMLRAHRMRGRRGLPLPLILLAAIFVFMSPVFGTVALALTGVLASFRRRSSLGNGTRG